MGHFLVCQKCGEQLHAKFELLTRKAQKPETMEASNFWRGNFRSFRVILQCGKIRLVCVLCEAALQQNLRMGKRLESESFAMGTCTSACALAIFLGASSSDAPACIVAGVSSREICCARYGASK